MIIKEKTSNSHKFSKYSHRLAYNNVSYYMEVCNTNLLRK